jgi:membrane protein
MLISNIELAFNDIWQVKHQRSIFRTVTDYIAMMFMLPIVIVLSSGLSIFITTLGDEVSDMMLIGPIMRFFITLAPYILLCCAFTALYIFMPNTKVRWKSAILPGILAGVSMQVFQMIYINSQIWISKYNAIYGSFAMIPFFLLWLQISWVICLIGAELTYCRQNAEDFLSEWMPSEPLSFNNRERHSWRIMEMIMERFRNGSKPINVWEIKQSLGLSRRTVNTLLYDLQRIHFIIELTHDEKSDTPKYVPAEAPENLTREQLRQRLADLGA